MEEEKKEEKKVDYLLIANMKKMVRKRARLMQHQAKRLGPSVLCTVSNGQRRKDANRLRLQGSRQQDKKS
jgi:hypothetical protein